MGNTNEFSDVSLLLQQRGIVVAREWGQRAGLVVQGALRGWS